MIKDCKQQEGSEPTLLALSLVDSITEDRTHVLLRRSTDEFHCAGTRMLAEEMGRGAPQLHLANGQKHAWVYGSCVSAIEAVSFRKSQRLAQAFCEKWRAAVERVNPAGQLLEGERPLQMDETSF